MKLTQEEFEQGCTAIEENMQIEVERRKALTTSVNELIGYLKELYGGLDKRNEKLNDYIENLKDVSFSQTTASNDYFTGIRTVNINANIQDMERITSQMKADVTDINTQSNIISKRQADCLNALKDLSLYLKAYEDIVMEIYDSQMELMDKLDSVYDLRNAT